ncbi:MAG TPA: hypothetical protein VIJ93_05830, partial [bacterium]
MNRTLLKAWFCLLVAGVGSPAFANHGAPSSTDRDGWINGSLDQLVKAGWVSASSKPIQELTNLEAAQ